jgi:predicted enzyme related to lactoylglutathione lyase
MRVLSVQNIYYVARDMPRQRAFYEGLLGLGCKFNDRSRWVQYAPGGRNLALATPGEAPDGVQGGIAVLEVETLDNLAAEVVAAGGTLVGQRVMGSHGVVATIRDSEGNLLQLWMRAADASR